MTISKAHKQSKSDTTLLHNGLLNATTGFQKATTHRNVWNAIDRRKKKRRKKSAASALFFESYYECVGWVNECVCLIFSPLHLSVYEVHERWLALKERVEIFAPNSTQHYSFGLRASRGLWFLCEFFLHFHRFRWSRFYAFTAQVNVSRLRWVVYSGQRL